MNETLGNPITGLLDGLVAQIPDTNILVWLLFFVVILYTVIHAVVFMYHWFKYNIAPKKFLFLTYVIYFSGVTFFLMSLFISTIAITS